jgi:hypothetical protein
MIAPLLAAAAAAYSASAPLPSQAAGAAPVRPAFAQQTPQTVPLPELPPPVDLNTPLPALPEPAAPKAETAKSEVAPAPAAPERTELAWAGSLLTSSGALGGLSVPSLATPGAGKLSLGASLDWHRGGDFLFPGSTSRRTGWAMAASYGAQSWLEAYGSLWFHSTSVFASAGRRTLGSYGDADLGVKISLPRSGPVSGGALLEVDVPSGVGSFSLKGLGGRAALLAAIGGRVAGVPLSLTALAGYRLDNTSQLMSADPGTFASYALALSRYDRVEGALALALPLGWLTPSAELEVQAAVARQNALPPGASTVLTRATLGAQAALPVRGLSWQGGVRLSLSRQGVLSERSLPVDGFAPDAPWQVFTGLAFSFEPRLPQLPRWSRDKQPEFEARSPQPAAPSTRASLAKARLVIVATDARTHLPVAGAWISFVESTDPGATTMPDGKARLEHDAGPATIAVAHEKYELWTEPLVLAPGEEKQIVVSLMPNAADATVRGRIASEEAVPLRAQISLTAISGGARPERARWFEGTYSVQVSHGQYLLQLATPGFRAEPVRIEVRPGETITHDFVLHRVPGEPTARSGPAGVEMSRPIPFVSSRSALFPVAMPVVVELAEVLSRETRPLVVEVRVEADDLTAGADADAQALLLSSERARALVQLLEEKGVRKGLLKAHGGGLAKAGAPLVEIAPPAEERPPRSQLAPSPSRPFAAFGGHP